MELIAVGTKRETGVFNTRMRRNGILVKTNILTGMDGIIPVESLYQYFYSFLVGQIACKRLPSHQCMR